jgi:hypothetical protein
MNITPKRQKLILKRRLCEVMVLRYAWKIQVQFPPKLKLVGANKKMAAIRKHQKTPTAFNITKNKSI